MPTLAPAVPAIAVLASAPKTKPDLTAVIVGHAAAKLPALVEAQAARMAKGEAGHREQVLTPEGRFLLLKPDEKPWLVGGEAWRVLGSQIAEAARSARATTIAVVVSGTAAKPQALVEGLFLGDYRFNQLRSGKEAARAKLTIHMQGHDAAVRAGSEIARAQNLARELADLPPNLLNPQTFAERAVRELKSFAGKGGLKVQILSGTERLRRAGFPGLAQVGGAGSTPPALVEIHWTPRGVAPFAPAKASAAKSSSAKASAAAHDVPAAKSTAKANAAAKGKDGKTQTRLALVGKGITFDSGGISLKPGDKMWEMKGDMSGAAAVLAAMTAIVRRRPDLPVSAYLCLAENMPDQHAQRPGDIYIARNGKTVHVDNTDAEGRLVLADVLAYACERGATHLVDLATLTGACVVALGEGIAGAMGRHEDWTRTVRQAGQDAGEELWPLPLYGEYRTLIDHPHADINNTGGRWGGSLTAGLFLAEFVPDTVQWVHLDIAGPAIRTSGWRYYAKGMTGFGTRTLIQLVDTL